MSRQGVERQRSLHLRYSTHVRTACRAVRNDMMLWRMQSCSELSLSSAMAGTTHLPELRNRIADFEASISAGTQNSQYNAHQKDYISTKR